MTRASRQRYRPISDLAAGVDGYLDLHRTNEPKLDPGNRVLSTVTGRGSAGPTTICLAAMQREDDLHRVSARGFT